MCDEFGGQLLVTKAAEQAYYAHDGYRDHGGAPYILHPMRVATALMLRGYPPYVVAAAWLHDVTEDTPITSYELLKRGFPIETVRIVELMDRPRSMAYRDYIQRMSWCWEAMAVKWFDMMDNLDHDRLANVPCEKRVNLSNKYQTGVFALMEYDIFSILDKFGVDSFRQ